MYALDFKYVGKYLSDFGFIICQFDAPDGVNVASSGSTITFNTISQRNGTYWGLVSRKYEECIQTTFDICKSPDLYDDLRITPEEYRDLTQWLCRENFAQLYFIDDIDFDTYYEKYYYDAVFNMDKIYLHDVLYGIRLTMQTNRPFAYGETITETIEVTETTKYNIFNIINESDEIGVIYPSMKITVKEDGDIYISNLNDSNTLKINNCVEGEVITINYPEIQTSKGSHNIANDFNYNFLRLIRRYNGKDNEIEFGSDCTACTVKISYNPIRKVGI